MTELELKNNGNKTGGIRLKKGPVIIAASLVVVLIIGIGVYAVSHNRRRNQDDGVKVNLSETNLKPENETVQKPATVTTIEILLDDSAIPVGTVIKAAALVTPEDTENALTWSSSNTSVFTVSSDGVITITGTGTAALTATLGTVSDAVAIEGIASVTDGSVNQYPVYTGGSTASNSAGSSDGTGNEAGNSSSVGTGNGTGSGSSGDSWTGETGGGSSGGSGAGSSGGAGNGSSGGQDDGTGSGSSDGTGNEAGNGSGNDSGGGSSSDSGEGLTSTDIGECLPSYGFEQEISNVYVYQDNSTYYGQIVTQPNVTICYIMKRSDEFDSKVIGVLEQLLPQEYNNVWNNYISAATDRTFTAEGRRVRIVASVGGGHSQIVIYN